MSIPATYGIHIHNEVGTVIHAEVFQSARAYDEACDYLEIAKGMAPAKEIWFTRMDGGEPTWVMKPLKRNADGTWYETT